MPWLIKGNSDHSKNLFFVHVPRCGGTSLMHHYDVPKKVMKGRSLWGKFGMTMFFHRYKLLETENFPWKTPSNLFCLIALAFGIYLVADPSSTSAASGGGIALVVVSIVFFLCLTFLFTAPTIGRITPIRRSYLMIVHYVLFRFMESIEWCTGTNKTGYMMHLTTVKLLSNGYVTAKEFSETSTMAIVRNPYSRMVSVYNYNRFGNLESFPKFVKDWHSRLYKPYRVSHELEEWFVPCHVIPQVEFTHCEGRQLVRSIVKQEELKFLKTHESEHLAKEQDNSVSDLPDLVRNALLGMPHTNSRSSKKKWWEYYDQETLDMVYDMYESDFSVFQYNPILTQRADLKPPKNSENASKNLLTNDEENVVSVEQLKDSTVIRRERMEAMRRDSWKDSSKDFRQDLICSITSEKNCRPSQLPRIDSVEALDPDQQIDSA